MIRRADPLAVQTEGLPSEWTAELGQSGQGPTEHEQPDTVTVLSSREASVTILHTTRLIHFPRFTEHQPGTWCSFIHLSWFVRSMQCFHSPVELKEGWTHRQGQLKITQRASGGRKFVSKLYDSSRISPLGTTDTQQGGQV